MSYAAFCCCFGEKVYSLKDKTELIKKPAFAGFVKFKVHMELIFIHADWYGCFY